MKKLVIIISLINQKWSFIKIYLILSEQIERISSDEKLRKLIGKNG